MEDFGSSSQFGSEVWRCKNMSWVVCVCVCVSDSKEWTCHWWIIHLPTYLFPSPQAPGRRRRSHPVQTLPPTSPFRGAENCNSASGLRSGGTHSKKCFLFISLLFFFPQVEARAHFAKPLLNYRRGLQCLTVTQTLDTAACFSWGGNQRHKSVRVHNTMT